MRRAGREFYESFTSRESVEFSSKSVQISRESVEFITESVNVGRESVERVELWQLFRTFENSW